MSWYLFIILVQCIGATQLYRHYSKEPRPGVSPDLPTDSVPHVTVLRPVKGLEPQLYECLAATFLQRYPRDKLTIYLCVSSSSDPAYPVLQRLISDFPGFDARVLIENEDPNLSGYSGSSTNLGPNPKIRNLSRGYREAKGDIVWIIDCNVWVGSGVLGRMVDKLCGFRQDGARAKPYKLVHHLPLVVDSLGTSVREEARGLLSGRHADDQEVSSSSTSAYDISHPPLIKTRFSELLRTGGGRLEEMFMATSHAKLYTAINTVSVAPCLVGKSNMFRRSHLDQLTSTISPYSPGIDFFSDNICEDHLIGDLLWRKQMAEEKEGRSWGKHSLVFGDMVIQPMAGMSIKEYIARRVRWLRVRKWTVTLATLIEPGVESLVCSAYGSFALTTLPWFRETFGIPQTWTMFIALWTTNVSLWVFVDWFIYKTLHSCKSVELNPDTPSFARPPAGLHRRTFFQWALAWIGRELLALPIWTSAVLGGTTVTWRSKTFWVGMDMKVHEINNDNATCSITASGLQNGHAKSKDRLD
ncbi:MAG: hypothetical protein M1818_002421 [Claussenomyces sp. TS43310]|nr:MAG: hypothetical protein M1818_002421 [Claussenomyces sp. TS43310]